MIGRSKLETPTRVVMICCVRPAGGFAASVVIDSSARQDCRLVADKRPAARLSVSQWPHPDTASRHIAKIVDKLLSAS